MLTPKSLFLILSSVSLNALAQVVLRKAMLLAPPLTPAAPVRLALQLFSNPFLWAGLCCYALSIGLWLAVLSKVQVSLAYPMLSIGYIIAAVLGSVFLHESLSSYRILGIGVICLGVILISRTQ
jgi:drug/metabolite transporter (DMT)-like permease